MDRDAVGGITADLHNQVASVRLQQNVARRDACRHPDGADASVQRHLAIAPTEKAIAAAIASS